VWIELSLWRVGEVWWRVDVWRLWLVIPALILWRNISAVQVMVEKIDVMTKSIKSFVLTPF
jgi:hypothetical protein